MVTEAIRVEHIVQEFDCGSDALNIFLKQYALANQRNNSARTYVFQVGDRVMGYYSLCAASASYEEVPSRISKGLARHPIPVVLLARLAIDKEAQGQGLGSRLLLDALHRFLSAQETIGARAILAHAKDDNARRFYERWGFTADEGLPYHLYMLTKDVKTTLTHDRP